MDAPARSEPSRAPSTPDRDGRVAFSRPPRRRNTPVRRPVVDALRDSTTASPALWERRPGQPDAFSLPMGVGEGSDGLAEVVTADLSVERAIALAGSEHFRSALARTMVIEAVTLHGPADLDLVILTSPDRLAHWDWAKWLPHLRLDGEPAIWSAARNISRWADDAAGRTGLATTPTISSHLTIAILDDPGLWNRRDSALRSIVANPPDHLRLIALCDEGAHAPAICTTIVSEAGTDRARLESFERSDDGGHIRPALAEATVAARVARSLAPLADIDLPPAPPPMASPSDAERIDASTLIGVDDLADIEAHWAADTPRPSVPIGHRRDEPVELAVSDDVTVVLGSSIGDAFDVAATLLLGQAVDRPPDALWIAPIVQAESDRSTWWWQLPHATDRYDLDTTVDVDRLLARLRAVLDDPAGPKRIVIAAEATGAAPTLDLGWLGALGDGTRSTERLALVVVTDLADVTVVGDTVIAVDQRIAGGGAARRREAVVTTRDGAPGPTFAPLQRSTSTSTTLVLEPFVIGRTLTPLERRIDRQRTQGCAVLIVPSARSSPCCGQRRANRRPRALDTIGRAAADADAGRPRRAVRSLAGRRRPTRPRRRPGRRTSRDPLVGTGAGIAARVRLAPVRHRAGARHISLGGSSIDSPLSTCDSSSSKRRRHVAVPCTTSGPRNAHCRTRSGQRDGRCARRDRRRARIDEVTSDAVPSPNDGPRSVVLIGDLVSLRRRYASHPLGARIDEVLVAASATDSGVDVVAYGQRVRWSRQVRHDRPRADWSAPRRTTTSSRRSASSTRANSTASWDGVERSPVATSCSSPSPTRRPRHCSTGGRTETLDDGVSDRLAATASASS